MQQSRSITLTAEGKRELEEQLRYLKTVRRPEIADRIGRAADEGDLSENGAYHQAKEDQARLDCQIAELSAVLRHAEVAHGTGDVIGIGKRITIQDETGTEKSYRLVSSAEVNSSTGNISDQSPIGSALVGKRAGDVVQVSTPGKTKELKVLAVH